MSKLLRRPNMKKWRRRRSWTWLAKKASAWSEANDSWTLRRCPAILAKVDEILLMGHRQSWVILFYLAEIEQGSWTHWGCEKPILELNQYNKIAKTVRQFLPNSKERRRMMMVLNRLALPPARPVLKIGNTALQWSSLQKEIGPDSIYTILEVPTSSRIRMIGLGRDDR